jgi:NADPH:quinone reductase-like Zn-dependent oxidoreductase
MRAARLVTAGQQARFALADLPDPIAGPDEVVVDVVAAALNRRDWWRYRDETTPVPITLGSDASGRVSAVGDGVDVGLLGENVVINATLGWAHGEHVPGPSFEILGSPRDGTFAEKVVVPADNIAPKPDRLSWEHAAALGSEVWVTTSSPEKLGRLLGLGARGGALYTDANWHNVLARKVDGRFDAAIDSWGGSGWQSILPLIKRGGTLVNFGDTARDTATITVSEIYWAWRSIVGTTMGSPDEYHALLRHVQAHDWVPAIDSVFHLDDIESAARRLTYPERFGKVVLRTSGLGRGD